MSEGAMAVCMSDGVNERILIRVEQRAIMNETIYKTPSLKSDAGVNVLLILEYPFPSMICRQSASVYKLSRPFRKSKRGRAARRLTAD
jgi:hypothetical protein